MRVLVCEDDPANRRLAERLLQRLGHEAEVAEDGRTAVDRATTEPFDLVLMDVHLPRLDGIRATQEIRGVLGDAAPPIVGLTASASDEDRRRCTEVGMAEVLGKPSRKADLERLAAAYRSRRPNDQAASAQTPAR